MINDQSSTLPTPLPKLTSAHLAAPAGASNNKFLGLQLARIPVSHLHLGGMRPSKRFNVQLSSWILLALRYLTFKRISSFCGPFVERREWNSRT